MNPCLVDNLLTFYSIELKLYGNVRADRQRRIPQTMDSVVQTYTHQSTAAFTTVRVVRYPGADI